MAKPEPDELPLPNDKKWKKLCRQLRLDEGSAAALKSTLEEAKMCWPRSDPSVPTPAEFKKSLRKVDKLLQNLEQGLSSQDVVDALRHLQTYGQMGLLISSTAALELDADDGEISRAELKALLARKKSRGEAIRASDLDALMLTNCQRRLNVRTADAMRLAVRAMRRPISAQLLQAKQDKGGAQPRRGRELLIFLLARDAVKIIGQRATSATNGPFANLCTWVFGSCGLDDAGLEDALERCLAKYADWLEWNALPEYSVQMGEPRGGDEDDIEAPLRSKAQP